MIYFFANKFVIIDKEILFSIVALHASNFLWKAHIYISKNLCELQKSPEYPDFKHKYTGQALWIKDKSNPPWVRSNF